MRISDKIIVCYALRNLLGHLQSLLREQGHLSSANRSITYELNLLWRNIRDEANHDSFFFIEITSKTPCQIDKVYIIEF
ncbi:hypothetical protein ES703_71386 [subsurface metagenome]